MRVAFITTFCAHYRRPLFELLARRHDVDFYFQSEGTERYWNRRLAPVQGDFSTVGLRRLRIAGQPLLPGLARTLTRDRYDAVVKGLDGRLMTPYVYALCTLRRLPLVLWTGMWQHPRTPAHALTRPLTEHLYRRADAIVTYGEHVRRFLADVPGVEPEKLFVAGQAVEADPFVRLERVTTDCAEVLYVGQLEPRKGLADLVAAFAHTPELSARLKIAGTGSLEQDLRRRLAAEPRASLLGHVPPAEVPRLLASARCLVVPSVTTRAHLEPWALVVNEAMHAGVPVVATTAVGAAAGGLVVHGRNGLVVPERDPQALGRAIGSLVEDAERAEAMGRCAREDVARLSYEAMVEGFEAALAHAVGGRRR